MAGATKSWCSCVRSVSCHLRVSTNALRGLVIALCTTLALMGVDEMLRSERIARDQRLRHTQANALGDGQLIRLDRGALRRQRIDNDGVQPE